MGMLPQVTSPHQLAELEGTFKLTGPAKPEGADWVTVVNTIGEFVSHAGWPIVALIALVLFRDLIGRLRMFKSDAVTLEFDQRIARAGKAAESQGVNVAKGPPSADEIALSDEVNRLAQTLDPMEIRKAVWRLAGDYEQTRSLLPSGDERTTRMEVIVSKMRSIGRAVLPMRYELTASPSPGQRLIAIASLQVSPDYELLEWLVDRLFTEKPFVSYHTAVALLVASNDKRGKNNKDNIDALKAALDALKRVQETLPADSDRSNILAEFKENVDKLVSP